MKSVAYLTVLGLLSCLLGAGEQAREILRRAKTDSHNFSYSANDIFLEGVDRTTKEKWVVGILGGATTAIDREGLMPAADKKVLQDYIVTLSRSLIQLFDEAAYLSRSYKTSHDMLVVKRFLPQVYKNIAQALRAVRDVENRTRKPKTGAKVTNNQVELTNFVFQLAGVVEEMLKTGERSARELDAQVQDTRLSDIIGAAKHQLDVMNMNAARGGNIFKVGIDKGFTDTIHQLVFSAAAHAINDKGSVLSASARSSLLASLDGIRNAWLQLVGEARYTSNLFRGRKADQTQMRDVLKKAEANLLVEFKRLSATTRNLKPGVWESFALTATAQIQSELKKFLSQLSSVIEGFVALGTTEVRKAMFS